MAQLQQLGYGGQVQAPVVDDWFAKYGGQAGTTDRQLMGATADQVTQPYDPATGNTGINGGAQQGPGVTLPQRQRDPNLPPPQAEWPQEWKDLYEMTGGTGGINPPWLNQNGGQPTAQTGQPNDSGWQAGSPWGVGVPSGQKAGLGFGGMLGKSLGTLGSLGYGQQTGGWLGMALNHPTSADRPLGGLLGAALHHPTAAQFANMITQSGKRIAVPQQHIQEALRRGAQHAGGQ